MGLGFTFLQGQVSNSSIFYQMNRAQTAGELARIKKTLSGTGFKFRPSTQQLTRDMHFKDSLSRQDVVDIVPKSITFINIEPNQTYETEVMVRNLTKIPRRIRVTQPQTARFRVDYDMQVSLAAGLAMKLVVYFEAPQLDDYYDFIKITSEENFSYQLRISALKPQPFISYDNFLDFGYCEVGKLKEKQIEFRNQGKEAGKVSLKCDKLKIDPSNFTVSPESSLMVTVGYQASQALVFRQSIQVHKHWNGQIETIEVSCISVDYSIFFIDSNHAQSTTIDFQEVIMGSLKCYSGCLVNNTPIQQAWKVIIKKGFHTMTSSQGGFQTPNEVGLEWLEKVVKVYPEKGTMEPYAQMPIRIECKGSVNEENIMKAANFAFKTVKEGQKDELPLDFAYSLFFEFQAQKQKLDETLIVHVQGKHVRPQVLISKQALSFGECMLNETKDAVIQVENTHRLHQIDVQFSKAPQFLVHPSRLLLGPMVKAQVIVTFAPKNVGKVSSQFDILLVDRQFPIKVLLSGHAIFNPTKRPVTRGPEALPQDFQLTRQFIDDNQLQYIESRRRQIKSESQKQRQTNYIEKFFEDESEQSIQQQQLRMQGMSDYEQERFSEKLQQFYKTRQNQEKYNEYLKSERHSRLQKKRDKILMMRVESMQEEFNNKYKGVEDSQPQDMQFQLGIMENEGTEQDPELPEAADGLFVTKPIHKYEPFTNQKKLFQPDPLQPPMKKPFRSEPETHKQIREVSMELNGEELKRIQAGPVEINFGNVFVKSKISRTFHIKNDLRTSISVQIVTDAEELQHTYQQTQIIPSSATARFEIVLKTATLGKFEKRVSYVINGHHRFEFYVIANIEPVKLEISQSSYQFSFKEENQMLETSEIIKLTNNGNAEAHFSWVLSEYRVFHVNKEEGKIEAGKSIDVQIFYKPSNFIIKEEKPQVTQGKTNFNCQIVNQTRIDEETLILQVSDGKDTTIKVQGQVNDARCVLKHNSVDMKELLVCKSDTKFFSIRNVSRVPAIFKILNEKLPAACDIVPVSGKIGPDESKDITVKYMSKEPTDIKVDIQIVIRGGRILKIPFTVKTIIPLVEILQDQFDFGKLTTLGNEGTLKMTLINNSPINAELMLNLDKESPESPDGIECLQVIPIEDLDRSVLKSVHEEEQPTKKQKSEEDEELNSEANSSDNEDELEQKIKSKNYLLTIQGNSKIDFYLKFSPRDVKTYTFDLPMSLHRFGKLPSITRQIICRGLKPRFVMDPQQVEFPRKIITSLEKCFPATTEITLSNPERKTVHWRMDTSSLGDNVFNIFPIEGKIDSGQTVKLKAQFNPSKADSYVKNVPVYIDSQESCYIELILKGQAAQPKIVFDRREVLLPVAPLNIEVSCSFRILNDGYENLTLRHKVFGEEGNINVKLRFPEGQILGMSKKRLRVDAVFQSSRTISFTTKIEFYDESGKVYTLPVSGTADNCLLTNYGYLQRSQGDFKIEEKSQGGPIVLVEDDEDVMSDHNGQGSVQNRKRFQAPSVISHRTLSSISGRTTASALGYSPIPQDLVESNKDYATRWLKFFVWTANINAFPEGVIEQDGQSIFELVSILSGKPLPLPCQQYLDKNSKKLDRIEQLLKQYDEFIRILKSEGALLNHIRPYHLLSMNDMNASFKLIPQEEAEYIHPNVLKINQQRFNYISIDSWCALFHQIIKIYALSRINYKFYRQIPGWGGDKLLPDCYITGSNIYSSHEGVLMRWLEVIAEQQGASAPRLKTFDQGLKDGLYIASALQFYVGPSITKQLQGMKSHCETQQDFNFNAQKLKTAFGDTLKFGVPFELQHFAQPSAREMVIFILHLFNQIPNYLPKGCEIFSCILGQSVMKTLLIQNKINRPVSYWVKLEKGEDFSLEGGDTIKLESLQPLNYKIKFQSRISLPVVDRITFIPKRDSNYFTAAIVYDLKSNIQGRESKSEEEVKGLLYEAKDFSITIQNSFNKGEIGNFQIRALYEKIEEKPKKKLNQSKQQVTEKKEEVFPAIFLRQEYVKLKKGQTYQLPLLYIPLVLEVQRCYLIFTDPNVGEFQHEILAIPELPEPPQEPKSYQIFVDQPQTIEFLIPPKNENVLQARRQIDQLYSDIKQKRALGFPGGEPESTNFDVEFTNHFGYIIAPKQFTVQDYIKQKQNRQLKEKQEKQEKLEREKLEKLEQKEKEKEGGKEGNKEAVIKENPTLKTNQTDNVSMKKMEVSMLSVNQSYIDQSSNKMPLTFTFKNPVKDMPIIMTLKSQDKTDVRRFKLSVTAYPKPTKAQMEMKCPSRESVVQEIPFINPSEKDWNIKFQLTQEGQQFQLLNVPLATPNRESDHQVFIGGYKDVQIKRKTRFDLKLQFTPKWMTRSDAHLQITNTNTNDVYDYQIAGIAEEPLAQSNIMLKCKARAQTKTEIVLNNHSKNVLKYRVETDLINASGLQSFTIQPQKKYRYELTVMPMLSGQYNGSISFYEESGEYIWYTVVLDTDSPMAEKEIEMLTQARKPIAFDIELSNPMPSEQATFEVKIEGDNLYGAKFFTVLPAMTSVYELIYLPLLPERKKAQIGFIHQKLGEIWYNIQLMADERQAIRVPTLRTELGKVEEYEVQLENPTGKDIQVEVKISNPANFDVLPADIVLAPYATTPVYIRYTPSSLDQIQNGEIQFITKEIGKWEYLVYGVGIPPTKFPELTVTVGINKDYSDVIHFKNPFRDTIQVMITIESTDENLEEAFQLLLKRKNDSKTTIPGLQNLQIPFSFTPRSIRSYQCEIVVAMNEKIKWKYPIVGHTESFATGKFMQFKTKCRIPFSQEFTFQLQGAGATNKQLFSFEIKNVPEQLKTIVDRFFKLKMINSQAEEGFDEIKFEAQFTPLKPFKANFDLIVKRESGGVWKFPMSLEGTPPDVDDWIHITSPLGVQESVSFRITNRTKQYADFRAYFLPSSDQEFTVAPKSGKLEPNGREGTQFVITFVPIEYGQIKQGKLIIETDDMYWSYQVRGTLPKYEPPKVGAKVKAQGEAIQTNSFKPKNFLQQNIKKSHSPPSLHQKSTQAISNLNMSRRTMGATLRDTKSVQGLRTTKME